MIHSKGSKSIVSDRGKKFTLRKTLKVKSNKIIRFFQTFEGIENGRKGECKPEQCETLEGEKGSACCKLGFVCPCLKKELICGIYKIRQLNCRIFPRTREDLKLVKNCGYYWGDKDS